MPFLCWLALLLPPSGPKITATEITFPRAEMALQEAVATLNGSGNRVADFRGRQGQEVTNPKLRLSIAPQRFWAAVDEVARQAGLRVVPFVERDGRPVVGLLARAEGEPASSLAPWYEGPFRMELQRITATRSWGVGEPSRLHVSVQVAWEPRYRPLWLNLPADGVQLATADGAGQPVPQLQPQSFRAADEAAVVLTVPLPLPPRSQEALTGLVLRTVVLLPPRQTSFALPVLAEGQQVEADGVTCTLTRIVEDRRQRRAWISLRLKYPEQALDLESHQAWVMQANTLVLTPKSGGQPLRFTTAQAEIDIRERAGIELRHRLDTLPEPLSAYTLRYEAPSPPVKYPLEMRLKNVPLP